VLLVVLEPAGEAELVAEEVFGVLLIEPLPLTRCRDRPAAPRLARKSAR